MRGKPPKVAETIVALLTPPACREEVLGDLHERFESPPQYAVDALRAVPLVILSRIRRTADPQVLVILAGAAYMSFLAAALRDQTLFLDELYLLRLALAAAMVLLGPILDDAWASPKARLPIALTRGPLFGALVTLAARGILALPARVMLNGCAVSFLLCCSVRILFPPATRQIACLGGAAFWRRSHEASYPPAAVRALKGIAAVVALALICYGLTILEAKSVISK